MNKFTTILAEWWSKLLWRLRLLKNWLRSYLIPRYRRPFTLLFIALFQILGLWYFQDPISSFLKAATQKGLWYTPMLPIVFGLPHAFFLWIWRNTDKQRSLQDAEKSLKQSELALIQGDIHRQMEWAFDQKQSLRVVGIDALGSHAASANKDVARKARNALAMILSAWSRENTKEARRKVDGRMSNPLGPTIEKEREAIEKLKSFEYGIKRCELAIKENARYGEEDDFMGVNLQFAVLAHTTFENVFFIRAELMGVSFVYANLTGSHFWQADLRGAHLMGANLERAFFGGANLSEADLTGADLKGALFGNANIEGANLTDVYNYRIGRIKSTIGTPRKCTGEIEKELRRLGRYI